MKLAITLNREGSFHVSFTGSNENQCGTKGVEILTYKVKIVGDNENLNSRGFLIDNGDIHNYFLSKYRRVDTFESCENIAAAACADLKAICEMGGAKVYSVDVTISGSPSASLTASWRAPKPQPRVEYRNRSRETESLF